MSNIAIVTDSTAYLTEEEVKRDAVTVVPLTVNFEDGAMEDGLIVPGLFRAGRCLN